MNIVLPKAPYSGFLEGRVFEESRRSLERGLQKPTNQRIAKQCPKIIQVNSNGFNKDHYPIDTLFNTATEANHSLNESQPEESESQNFFLRVMNKIFKFIFVDFWGLSR